MKKRSIVGIVLTGIGVILIILAVWPSLLESDPAPGFGPYQTVVLIMGVIIGLIGWLFCSRTRKCGCCGAKPAEGQKTEPPPGT